MARSHADERMSADDEHHADDGAVASFESADPQEFVVLSSYSREKLNRFSEGLTPPEEFYDDFFAFVRRQQTQSQQRYARLSARKDGVRHFFSGLLSALHLRRLRRA